jgi:primosomal protein N' (replication factor Y)
MLSKLHPSGSMSLFADVIVPLPLPKRSFTYAVPGDLAGRLMVGMRVEVPFGRRKVYSGVVERLHTHTPDHAVKSVLDVLDDIPVVTDRQLLLWEWLAAYYASTMGEVMQVALPGHLKLSSETKVVYQEAYGEDFADFSAEEYVVAEALLLRRTLSLEDVQLILGKKSVASVIQRLLDRGVLVLREDLQEKYKPKRVLAVQWTAAYEQNPALLKEALVAVDKYPRQSDTLLAFYALLQRDPLVRKRALLQKLGTYSDAPLMSLVRKGILEVVAVEESRIGRKIATASAISPLTPVQQLAVEAVRAHFEQQRTVLLYGVTGSGKTRVYLELIREVMEQGGQVLYLMPEIALTTHLTARLQQVLGSSVLVYHSRVNHQERVELWRAAAAGRPVLVAARSGLFLPFKDLRLVVVDEEHEPSFKQFDPAPRYQARDAAIYLAGLYGARVILGSATPSVESWYNTTTGKYGLVRMRVRYGDTPLPKMEMVNLAEAAKKRNLQGVFSDALIQQLRDTIRQGNQAILFQNRRGFAPLLTCETCGWTSQCKHCDVSLTYHKQGHRLRCHYCGYQETPQTTCPACGSGRLVQVGFGTERLEDDLAIHLPDARIARLDLDTAGSKERLSALLRDVEEQQIDVLIGTQMLTKGLDFEHVQLVGVVSADQSLRFPDFRASERTFQLLTQVAGRAGRRKQRGLVLIQSWNPEHPVLQDVLKGDYEGFVDRELKERRQFLYPPFCRLIHITVRHSAAQVAADAAQWVAGPLRNFLGDRVLGPVPSGIPKVRGLYAQEIMLKLDPSNAVLSQTKRGLLRLSQDVSVQPGWSGVRVAIDVDP